MGRKGVIVSGSLVAQLFTEEQRTSILCVKGLPPGAQLVAVHGWQMIPGQFVFEFEHDSFDNERLVIVAVEFEELL